MRPGAALRRALFFGTSLALTVLATLWLTDILWAEGLRRAHYPLILLTFVLLGLLCLGCLHAVFGFFAGCGPRARALRITALADGQTGPLRQRHAVVMPTYNEEPAAVCARLEAIYRSIQATGHLDSFDFYLLSDTRDLDLWIIEETAWANLCRNLDGFGRIFYRRRRQNTHRKAGNIGDFVRRWGGKYEAMLILDADSLMDGADIVTMARVMEAHPRLGILQTAPKLIRGTTLFARLQQFAMRLYSPLFVRGLNFWQLGQGSYWGHNALIRIKPFSEHCDLPPLPGKEPFGGHILSHDFVEAALMVAQGWEVWLAWDIEGSYEECPPTLVDHLIRDRRWAQGNLQHLWLIFARKLPHATRMHLFMGIMAYLASPLWLCLLGVGTFVAWDQASSGLSRLPFDNFGARWFGLTLPEQNLVLLACTLAMLLLPKALATLRALVHGPTRRSFGGGLRILGGVALEIFLSMLLAPAVMVGHCLIVASIVLGRSVGWNTQNRDADGTPWSLALRVHAAQTLLGVGWAVLAWQISPAFLQWMAPILAGLILSAPISVFTSRVRHGRRLQQWGLLGIPEERQPPPLLHLADQARASQDPSLDAQAPARRGLISAVVDPYVNCVHATLLDHETEEKLQPILAERLLAEGATCLDKADLERVLHHRESLLGMHRAVWSRPREQLAPVWHRAVDSYRRPLESPL